MKWIRLFACLIWLFPLLFPLLPAQAAMAEAETQAVYFQDVDRQPYRTQFGNNGGFEV